MARAHPQCPSVGAVSTALDLAPSTAKRTVRRQRHPGGVTVFHLSGVAAAFFFLWNVNGSTSDQVSSQADHTCVLAIPRQRRKRQVCQISEHIEERVERTKNKDITSRGCSRKISSRKTWVLQMLDSHKTKCTTLACQNKQIDKTCIGRRTDSAQNMYKWISQVPQIPRHRR